MRGIALKIFVSFWLIFAVLIASFALLPDSTPNIRFQDHLRAHAKVASSLRSRSSVLSCNEYVADVAKTTGVRMALFDAHASPICRAADDNVTDLRQLIDTPLASRGSAVLLEVSSPSGEKFYAAGKALPRFAQDAAVPPFPYRTVVYAIVLSGVVCFGMARYLARPLQLVRNTSYRLAAGDLHARAGPEGGRRRDEIGDLVRDFDAMAARIENLLQSQNQLLSDISHELRSPLARLNVALELARRKANPEMAGDLTRIEMEAERMNDLIARVLTLARAESNPHESMTWFDLPPVVAQVAADAEYEAQRQDKSVVLGTRASPTIYGHRSLIASAVDNVVRNALRHTAVGTAVTIVLDASDREALISVRDRGPGVPASELDRIFTPFYRIELDRNRETGGVGLGLAIARRAVAVHQGSISAENVLDGLLVTIRLPLRPLASSADKSLPRQT